MNIIKFISDKLKKNDSLPSDKPVSQQEAVPTYNKLDTSQNEPIPNKSVREDKYKANYVAFDKWLCPYCSFPFEKQVTRKRKCPSCKNSIAVRTHHDTNRKMILKEEQLSEYEKEKTAFYNDKWIKDLFKRYNTTLEEEQLKNMSGSPYSYDIAWGMLNRIAMERASEMQFGLFRNVRMDMGDLLKREGKLKHSLLFYLEVCYLDINGANNTSTSPEVFAIYPPYRLNLAFLAPGILANIETISEELHLSLENIKDEFINHNTRCYKDDSLVPLSPEKAWITLEKEFLERKRLTTI